MALTKTKSRMDGDLFDTVAAMVAATPSVGSIVRTKGYYTEGDGGGATYLIEAAGASYDGITNHQLANSNVATQQYVNTTHEEKTYYVSPAGSDTSGDGTSGSPWATIQRAVDAIPTNVHHRQTIQLMDGTHNTGSRNTDPIAGSSTVRTVRCLIDNKNVHGRDMIVIQGNTSNKALTVVNHDDVYSAFYVEETNGVVLKDLTINCASNVAAAISIFQHRKGDMRISDVTLIGNDVDGSHAIIGETGSFIEIAGVVSITDYERAIVALEAVISFTGTSITHDGGTASAPRTFEVGSFGELYIFSGSLTCSNIQRLGWCKSGYLLLSPSSSTLTVSGFVIDCDESGIVDASNLACTAGAYGIYNTGGKVKITTCNFTDQTTSAVYNERLGTVIVDDCTLSDSTNTKAVINSVSGSLEVYGDGDITGGYRQIFVKNTNLKVGNQMNFGGTPAYCIDARSSNVRLEGTSGNPITFAGYTTNCWYFKACNVTQYYCTVTNPTSKTACIAIGSQIDNEGGVNINGGFRGYDLSQNTSLTAETTTGSDLTNMSEGINARRGSQVYYRSSSMDFTGTTTPTVDSAAQFSLVTSF